MGVNGAIDFCPVCGFDDTQAYDAFGCSTFEICACCAIEFGNDDFPGPDEDQDEKWLQLRERWLRSGAKFWKDSSKPDGWNAKIQLANKNLELPSSC